MTRQVDAVYENGALRPLEPLLLKERQRVVVTISDFAAEAQRSRIDVDYLEAARNEMAGATDVPTLEEVRQRLSRIPGSMAADVTAEREDR